MSRKTKFRSPSHKRVGKAPRNGRTPRPAIAVFLVVAVFAALIGLVVLGESSGSAQVTVTEASPEVAAPLSPGTDASNDSEASDDSDVLEEAEDAATEDQIAAPPQSDEDMPDGTASETPKPASESPPGDTPDDSGPEGAPEPTATPEVTGNDEDDFGPGSVLPDAGMAGQLATIGGFDDLPEIPTVIPKPVPVIDDPLPAPQPIQLAVQPAKQTKPEPVQHPEPSVSLAPVAQGAPDGLAGDASGCLAHCVQKALLHKNIRNADLDFELKTSVNTTSAIWVLPSGPLVVNGVLRHTTVAPRAVNTTAAPTWNATINGLAHDTTYRFVLTVTDEDDNLGLLTTEFRTAAEPVDTIVVDGPPCSYECIDYAELIAGPTFDVASISVGTNADVYFNAAVSTIEPDLNASNPFAVNEVTFVDWVEEDRSLTTKVIGLAPETTYYAVVGASDHEGTIRYVTASFTTDPAPVVPEPQPLPEPDTYAVAIGIERFHVHDDADSIGKGEITFRWMIDDFNPIEGQSPYFWYLPFDKIGTGESVNAGGVRIVNVEEDWDLPPVIINAVEADTGCPLEVGSFSLDSYGFNCDISHFQTGYDLSTTAAELSGIDVAWIEALPTCDAWNVPTAASNDRCYVIQSEDPGDGFVVFDALVVFRVIPT